MKREAFQKTQNQKRELLISGGAALFVQIILFIIQRSWLVSAIAFVVTFAVVMASFFARKMLKKAAEIKKMETVFPDFIQLVASNLRAGMTIDRSLLLSSRKEFAPLDKEILSLGKEIVTGKEIDKAMLSMADRINSEKIRKTVTLIISGLRSGGNLATLLEETAANLRERDFVEKRAASNVLMYAIFIFFAVAIGAPTLFGLSSVLVKILTTILGNLPDVEASAKLPLTLTKITVSPTFITYFSVIFLVVIDVLASLILGLVSKGDERSGIKFIIPLILISLVTFFTVRLGLLNYFSDFFTR